MESDPENDDVEYVLIGGPCCGDTIQPARSDTHIRLGVVAGTCLDREVPLHLKGEYTEALYTRMPDGKWVYIGRYRWDKDRAYFSES